MNVLINTEFRIGETSLSVIAFRVRELYYSLDESLNHYARDLDVVDRYLFNLAKPQIIKELKEKYL